jgi:hypothetical protein
LDTVDTKRAGTPMWVSKGKGDDVVEEEEVVVSKKAGTDDTMTMIGGANRTKELRKRGKSCRNMHV